MLPGSILQSNASHSIVTVFHDLLRDFQVFHLKDQELWREGHKNKGKNSLVSIVFHSTQNDPGRKGKVMSYDDTQFRSLLHPVMLCVTALWFFSAEVTYLSIFCCS